MARISDRLDTNVEGEFFVDASCIDCDTCRWMAPETFDRAAGQSRVHRQPDDPEAERRALQALISCPTASIGTVGKTSARRVLADFPLEVEAPVYHCGYHHEASFGAASYLIVREAGNVLVDSPRFAGPLVERLEALGGVDTLFLTHQDDVADHARFHEHFGCRRILHEDDVRPGTEDVELKLSGQDPIVLDDEITLLPVPGHTRGSVCLLFRERFLFTGDHLAWSERLGHLYAFRSACWYDWKTLVASMDRLAEHPFTWVLPGHGRRRHIAAAEMPSAMQRCIDWCHDQP